jgi:hypothetical protein
MKFVQEENLELNRNIEKKLKENKKFETREDFIAHCVRKELGIKDVE